MGPKATDAAEAASTNLSALEVCTHRPPRALAGYSARAIQFVQPWGATGGSAACAKCSSQVTGPMRRVIGRERTGALMAVLSRKLSLATTLLWCCSTNAEAPLRPAVVELFTSQGCSSCPPADTYLGELSQRQGILALSFHVDYWDDLGWKDPFALSASTERQRRYSHSLGHSSVYTPQVVVDGESDYVGADRGRIGAALARTRIGVPVNIDLDHEEVRVELTSQPGVTSSDVIFLMYRRKAVSSIGRGENAGRMLEEFNIVRSIQYLGHWKGDSASFRVPVATLAPDATDVAVLVQLTGQHQIIGAATRTLR